MLMVAFMPLHKTRELLCPSAVLLVRNAHSEKVYSEKREITSGGTMPSFKSRLLTDKKGIAKKDQQFCLRCKSIRCTMNIL